MNSVNRICMALALLLAPFSAQAAEIGAFFTQVNAYVYTSGPREGKRFLARPRQSFSVLNVHIDDDDKLWLLVLYPKHTQKQSGSGWTPLTPGELFGSGEKQVEIFAYTPGAAGIAPVVARLPAKDVKLLNETQPSTRFPQVVWQKVSYASAMPMQGWIQGVAGIFRPGKTSEFLGRVYVEMVSRNLEKEKLERLLAGVIRVGDSPWDVERALGAPLRVEKDQSSSDRESTWQYPSLSIRFDNDVVNQIN